VATVGSKRHLKGLADEDLMPLVQRGEAAAFEVVFDRHADAAYALAYRICGSRGRAEDAVQEAFISVWRSGGRYERSRGSVRTWVLGIVHHRAIDAVRREFVHARRRTSDEGVEERFAGREQTDLQAIGREEARTVRAAMEGLPTEQKRVIELAYYAGHTHTEIAEILDAPVGTIKGRMRLALVKLRGALEPAEVAP
jgi:RNA polymerase sigma-70 factor (ECF subfamily)